GSAWIIGITMSGCINPIASIQFYYLIAVEKNKLQLRKLKI
ncbi:MAG: hypothetical protein ACI90C_001108, partial [Rhodoferax sp.]